MAIAPEIRPKSLVAELRDFDHYHCVQPPPVQGLPSSGIVNDVATANGRFRPSIDKKEKEVFAEEKISLDCPYCGEEIYESLSWFKRTYFTCPACQKGLAAGQFAAIIADIEEALDARIEEDVQVSPGGGCCREKHSAVG